MQSTFKIENEIRLIRRWLLFFMLAMVVSGLSAMPVQWELQIVTRLIPTGNAVGNWLDEVQRGVTETAKEQPWLFYGFDWLAFAHIVLALFFIGPYREPVKNKWVVECGIYACLLIIPFTLMAGAYRGIPFWWKMVDASFGIFGMIPLCTVLKKINRLEDADNQAEKL